LIYSPLKNGKVSLPKKNFFTDAASRLRPYSKT